MFTFSGTTDTRKTVFTGPCSSCSSRILVTFEVFECLKREKLVDFTEAAAAESIVDSYFNSQDFICNELNTFSKSYKYNGYVECINCKPSTSKEPPHLEFFIHNY